MSADIGARDGVPTATRGWYREPLPLILVDSALLLNR